MGKRLEIYRELSTGNDRVYLPKHDFYMTNNDCIFCKIAAGQAKAHIIWSDEKHIAFLSIFPNTEGFSVVIPRKHYPSYNFDLPDEVLKELVIASKKVGRLLDKSFDDVSRTGLIMEGFGIDHVHTKLIPMHGTGSMKVWQPIHSSHGKFFDTYEGYLSSHDADRADEKELEQLARLIRGNTAG